MKVFALGAELFTAIFKSIGCEVQVIDTPSQVISTMEKITSTSEDVGLILIERDMASKNTKELTKIRLKHPLPLIYAIDSPFQPARTGEDYRRELMGMVEEAQSV